MYDKIIQIENQGVPVKKITHVLGSFNSNVCCLSVPRNCCEFFNRHIDNGLDGLRQMSTMDAKELLLGIKHKQEGIDKVLYKLELFLLDILIDWCDEDGIFKVIG